MQATGDSKVVRTSTMWYILSAIFFAIGIISALGEWVFHWWASPGDVTAPLGLLMGMVTVLVGNLDRLGQRLEVRFDQLGDRMDGQFEHLGDRMDQQVEHLGDRMDQQFETLGDRMDQRFDRLDASLQELIRGQQGQTRLLRELVDSFQRQREGGAGVG